MPLRQEDLVVPAGRWADEAEANEACRAWCAEVNGARALEIAAVPAQRLAEERDAVAAVAVVAAAAAARRAPRKVDKLATVRIGSARYSVPRELVGRDVEVVAAEGREVVSSTRGELVARHPLVAPGEVSIIDEHYGGPGAVPARAVRPRSGRSGPSWRWARPRRRSCAPRRRRARPSSAPSSPLIAALEAAWGRDALVAALERAVAFRRFKAADVRSILEAGAGVPTVADEGEHARPRPARGADPIARRLPPRGAGMTAASPGAARPIWSPG